MDLSGREVEVLIPPEALRVLGQDWGFKNKVPKIALQTRLIPDWEFPGYWLLKDNRDIAPAELAGCSRATRASAKGNSRRCGPRRAASRAAAAIVRAPRRI